MWGGGNLVEAIHTDACMHVCMHTHMYPNEEEELPFIEGEED